MGRDPLDQALDAAERAAWASGLVDPPENRAQRRQRGGLGAGEGKHPLGATKPLAVERKADRRRRRRSR